MTTYCFDTCRLNIPEQELWRDGTLVPLEPQVFRILIFLIENQTHVVTKDELVQAIWDGRIVSDATITSRINLARQAVGDTGRAQKIIRTFPKRGFRFVAALHSDAPAREATATHVARTYPRVTVLPFESFGEEASMLASGLTDEITVALSRYKDIAVVARGSAEVAQIRATQPAEIGDMLGARYSITGSVRRVELRLRITVQLTDNDTGTHVWADRFDEDLDDFFDVQDRIVSSLAGFLPGRMYDREVQSKLSRRTSDLSAYEIYLRSEYDVQRDGDIHRQMERLALAIQKDPTFGLAHAALGFLYGYKAFVDGRRAPNDLQLLSHHADLAVTHSPDDERVLSKSALSYVVAGDHDRALHFSEEGLRLNPNCVECLHIRGIILGASGQAEQALALQKRAMELDPLVPGYHSEDLIESYFLLGQYEGAIHAYERWSAPLNHVRAEVAACHAMLGQTEKANALVKEFIAKQPEGYRVDVFVDAMLLYIRRDEDKARWREGFQRAGLLPRA